MAEYAGTACTNQFVRSLSALGASTCATLGASDVSLANLTATDGTLTFSGTYTGATARTIGLNLGQANTWSALQQFGNSTSTLGTIDKLWSTNASTTNVTVTGYANLEAATVKQHIYRSFNYATSTSWSATTTRMINMPYTAEKIVGIKCKVIPASATLNVNINDGTNLSNMLTASTTVGQFGFTTNNTFTASETMYVSMGTPTNSPTEIVCGTDSIVNN